MNSNKSSKNNKNLLKEKFFLIGVVLIVFFLQALKVGDLLVLRIAHDDFGYWAGATYFLNYDWSSVIIGTKLPYYSFVYSLVLLPLLSFIENTITMYNVGILINIFISSLSVLVLYRICKRILVSWNQYMVIGVCLLLSVYPANLFNSFLIWTEQWIRLLLLLMVYLFLNLSEKNGYYKVFLLALLCGGIYSFHMRTIGVIISCVAVITIMCITKKISKKQLIVFGVVLIAVLAIQDLIRDSMSSEVWSGLENFTKEGPADKGIRILIKLASIDNLVKLFGKFLGHFYYIGAASFLIMYFGIYEMLKEILKTIKGIIKEKSLQVLGKKNDTFFVYMFLIIAFILMFCISIIYLSTATLRIDHIVYGRYIEFLSSPIMLFGFYSISKYKITDLKIIKYMVGIFFVNTCVMYVIFLNTETRLVSLGNITGLPFLILPLKGLWLSFGIATIGFYIFYNLYKDNTKFYSKIKGLLFISIAYIVIFNFTFNFMEFYNLANIINNKNISKITNCVREQNEKVNCKKIYYIYNDEKFSVYMRNGMSRRYQFMLRELSLDIVKASEYHILKKNHIIIVENKMLNESSSNKDLADEIKKDYKFCTSTEFASVYTYIVD